jgi:hypothetical protein
LERKTQSQKPLISGSERLNKKDKKVYLREGNLGLDPSPKLREKA